MSDTIETFDIERFKDPSYIKSLNEKQLKELCEQLRKEILKQVSTYGGHLSPNLGVVELTVALHRVFNLPEDKLIFDVGHQSYVHKLLSGRSLEHLNTPGHSQGFQKIAESPYDPYEAGHSSNSISAAEGFAIARDIRGEKFDVIALIGDSSITNGLAFEGLNDLAGRDHKVIIVLNDNDMSISPSVGGLGRFLHRLTSGKRYAQFKDRFKWLQKRKFGKHVYKFFQGVKNWFKRHLMPMTFFDNLGLSYLGPIDGHNLKQLERTLRRAKNAPNSVLVHVRTIKGKGYEPAENDQNGYWHGVTPFDIETGLPKGTHPGKISYSHYVSNLTDKIMDEHKETFLIVPATLRGSGLETPYFNHKERAIDVGIAEEHALTLAGSLSLNGFHPIVSIYSTFLQRAYDEVSHDCARLHANLTLLIERAGLVGKNGDTHQGLYDVAFLKTIPDTVITMPSDAEMVATLYAESLKNHGIFAIRYPREFVDENSPYEAKEFPYLGYRTLKQGEGKRLLILAVGPAGKELASIVKENKGVTVIDPVYLHPINPDLIEETLSYDNVLVYDPYSTEEGFASSIAAKLGEKGYKGRFISKAVPTCFVHADSLKNQRGLFLLNPEEVASFALTLLQK